MGPKPFLPLSVIFSAIIEEIGLAGFLLPFSKHSLAVSHGNETATECQQKGYIKATEMQ